MSRSGGGLRRSPLLAFAVALVVVVVAGCGRVEGPGQSLRGVPEADLRAGTSTQAATGTDPGPAQGTLAGVAHVARAVRCSIKLADDKRRPVAEVSDTRMVKALAEQIARAVPVEKPPEGSYDQYILELMLPGGRESEVLPYWVKGPTKDLPGYVRFQERWYEVPAQLGAMLSSLDAYQPSAAGIRADDERFLAKYGWTPFFLINESEVTLPGELAHRPGEFPSVLYWAYNNELNRDIGLDLTPHLGEKAIVRLYKIAELLPEFMEPRRECGRAVIVLREGEMIGAWLDAGRHHAFACSLVGCPFEEITGKTWDQWISAVIDEDDAIERELSSLTPEEVIRRYYEAIGRGDQPTALACLSRRHLLLYLFGNMDNRGLYNPGFYQESWEMWNTTSARVDGIEKMEQTSAQEGTVMYQVTVDLTVERPVTHESGRHFRFVSLRRETPDTGWRIYGIGTGP